MITHHHAMAAILMGTGVLLGAADTSAASVNVVSVQQGGVARWANKAASECGVYGKRFAAVDAACYYPADIRTAPGAHEIALWDQDGKQHMGTLQVRKTDFPKVEMELTGDAARFVEPSAEDAARAAKEREEVVGILDGTIKEAGFSLPLAAPTASLPKSEDDFGSERTFNGTQKSTHSGRDYPVGPGNALKAVADGTVVLAADHFYTGNAVYIDHGAGLVSMNFHLESIAVKTGDVVKRGDTIGKVGGTGRATGPHLHIGMRWLGKRIDPALLLASPSALPQVSDSTEEALQKIEKAKQREPDETDDTTD